MHGLLKDLRYALRSLLRSPGFTAAAVIALGLGIGSATAIFSLLDGVVLRPLPYREPERLVTIWEVNHENGRDREQLSPVNFMDYRLNGVFEDAAAWWRPELNLTDESTNDPIRISAIEASANFFSVLGVRPQMGPGFTYDGTAIFSPNTEIVISHRLWQSRFAGDRNIVGRTVRLDGAPHQVVGVMPPGFGFPGSTDVWDRLQWNLSNHSRGAHFMESVARLEPGVTVDQVNRELGALTARLAQENTGTNGGWGARALKLDREVAGIFRPALFALFGAAGLLLVIACINVANLLLARATARQREVAIRAAMGASRARLVRHLLAESLVLGAMGGLLGLGIAIASVRGLLAWSPIAIPRAGEIHIDALVLAFTTGLALLTALGFGLAPALLVSRAELHDALKEATKSASAGVSGQRARNALVVAEVALAVMLLSGAGLLIRSVGRMLGEETGVGTTRSLTADVQLPAAAYGGWDRVTDFYATLMERVRANPQVAEAGASNFLPLDPAWRIPFRVVGSAEGGEPPLAQNQTVDERYFAALGVPIVRGRGFTDRDLATTTPVVVINETAAKQHFGGEDPIGKRIQVFATNIGPLGRRVVTGNEHEVIGIVGDVKNASLKDVAEPAVFFTYRQFPFRKMYLVVRGRADGSDLLGVVREEVRKIDPGLPVANVRTMDRVLATSVDPPRFVMLLMTAFAGLALVLAAVGIYGILSYAVSARQKEMGIRLALGARPGQVLAMILREGLLLVIVGCAIGVVGAWIGGRSLGGLLYGVGAADPVTWLGVVTVVVGIAIVACVIPGRRAARVDAVGILRGE